MVILSLILFKLINVIFNCPTFFWLPIGPIFPSNINKNVLIYKWQLLIQRNAEITKRKKQKNKQKNNNARSRKHTVINYNIKCVILKFIQACYKRIQL